MRETEQVWGTVDFHGIFLSSMEVNNTPKKPDYKLSSAYLPLCSAKQTHSSTQKSYSITVTQVNVIRYFPPLVILSRCGLPGHDTGVCSVVRLTGQ